MKYLKEYKIFETGEWSSDVDWDFVKENPDNDSEEANWIRSMENKLNLVKNALESEEVSFEIENIRGYDMYQGPYASVLIDKINYDTVWFGVEGELIFERSKLTGYENEIIEALIDKYRPINKETRKFNI